MEELRSNRPAQVSIIIPARNEEKSLGDLLASLKSLDFPRDKFEVIVVDHESTDRTVEIALAVGARVVKKSGGNISSARNFGASQAAGQILAFLDADCTVAEDWLSRAVAHFADPEVGAVGSYHIIPLDPPTWVRIVLQKQVEARPRSASAKWLPSGNMLIRREVFLECNGFDEFLETCEDVDLSYRITRKYRLIADSNIRCWHHREPASLLQLFRKELWRGRDNLSGAFRHGVRWVEIPSLVLPLYSVATFCLFIASPLIGTLSSWGILSSMAWAGLLFLLPTLAVAALTGIRTGAVRYVPHLTLLYAVYFLARGLAPFYRWRYVWL